jgi:hypothetical protein
VHRPAHTGREGARPRVNEACNSVHFKTGRCSDAGLSPRRCPGPLTLIAAVRFNLHLSMLQVSVYPDGHAKTEGLQLKRQPGSKASKRLEAWQNTPRR